MTDYGALLRDHVTLRCRSIDRIFLQAYVPRLQAVGDVCTFLRWQRRYPIPSSAAFGKIGEGYVKAVYRFAEAHHIPVVHFKKGEKKEERRGRISTPRRGKERTASCSSGWHRRRRRFGNRGRGRDRRRRPTRTWTGDASRPMSITSISISGMPNGARRSGKPTPTRPFRSGSG